MPMSKASPTARPHSRPPYTLLLLLILISRLVTASLLFLAHLFPLFDAATSHILLRWDALHFLHIARSGYVYEHEWAFFPVLPLILSLFSDSLLAPTLFSLAISFDTTLTMYSLSLHHLGSPTLA